MTDVILERTGFRVKSQRRGDFARDEIVELELYSNMGSAEAAVRRRRNSLYKRALGGIDVAAIGLAMETDRALSVGPPVSSSQVGFAASVNSALALTRLQITATGTASEFNLSLQPRSVITGALGMATETDTALETSPVNVGAVGMATSTSTALALDPGPTSALDLQLAANRTFPGTVTFSRASAATYIDATGTIASAGSGAARFGYSPYSGFASLGYLEEGARTNIARQSQFGGILNNPWTLNGVTLTGASGTAPDGTNTAVKLIENAVAGFLKTDSSGIATAVSASTVYCCSLYVKAGTRRYVWLNVHHNDGGGTEFYMTFDTTNKAQVQLSGSTSYSIEPYANGWTRISISYTTPVGTTSCFIQIGLNDTTSIHSYTGDGSSYALIWGVQLEAANAVNPGPSSYKAVTTADVSVVADAAAMTGTDFSGFYNASEGTFVPKFRTPAILGTHAIFCADDGTANNSIKLVIVTGHARFQGKTSGVAQFDIDLGAVAANTEYTAAIAYKANDAAGSLSGAAVVTDTSCTIPTVNQLELGRDADATPNYLFDHVKRLTYYNTRLSNAQLVLLAASAAGIGGGGGGIVSGSVGVATSTNTALALGGTVTTYGAADNTSGRPSLAGYTLKDFVADYGGNGNGTFDNSTALNNAMAAANGTAIYFPPGTYAYSNYHQMSSKNNILWYGAGYGSTILKPTGVNSNTAIVLWNCTNIKMVDFKLWAANTTARVDTGANCGFYIFNCPGPILVQNVWVENTPSGAILTDHSVDVSLIHCTVYGSKSDSFHFTGQSSNGLAQYCWAKNSGDDCFAAIGYGAGTGQNLNIQFLDNLAEDCPSACGVDFQGTDGGAAKRNKVYRTGAAGIQLSAVSSFGSGSVTNIAVEDNWVEDCVTRSELAGSHGAIFLLTQTTGQHVSGITLLRNTVKNARYATEAFRGNAADATRYIQATLTNNVMIRTTGPMVNAYAVTTNVNFTKSGNTYNGAAAP